MPIRTGAGTRPKRARHPEGRTGKSVRRRGRIVRSFDNRNITVQDIANEMVGRAVLLSVDKSEAQHIGQMLLKVDHLRALGNRGETAVDDLSLQVRAGEIVGLAGVQGNGQDELVECITGMRTPAAGRVEIDGIPASASPHAARKAGLA